MLSYENQIIGFVLIVITIVEILLAYLFSLIILMILIYHFFDNHIKRQDKTILILCFNIYFFSLIYLSFFLVLNIQTILGDLYQIDFNSPACIFIGYIYSASLCVLTMSFINQAFFRLCRIVYSQYKYFQTPCLYLLIIPFEIILALLLSSPIYIWNEIIYLPDYHFCYVPISNIRSYLWIFFTVYGLPVLSITMIYIRITRYIRKQSNQALKIKRRQIRELKAIRGIFILVGLLILFGLPTSILIIMMLITGREHPLTFRVTCISIGTSMVGLSIAMMIFVPQLKTMIWKILKSKRVKTMDNIQTNSTQLRSISSNR